MALTLSTIAEDLLTQLAAYSGPLPVFSAELPIATQLVDAGLAAWTKVGRMVEATPEGKTHSALILRRKGIG